MNSLNDSSVHVTGALETVAVVEGLGRTGLPAVEAVKFRAELVLPTFADVVAQLAFPK
jgi:hypothetical protein